MTATGTSKRAWVIKVAEPLPLPGATIRLMRAGQIAESLRDRNADVTWWVSDFNHSKKRYQDLEGIVGPDRSGILANGIRAQFLHGRPYARNVSFARILNQREEARDFAQRARRLPQPDVIFCCYPTINLAREATLYGKERGIPVVLDIRDLWPDIFLDVSPLPAWFTKLALLPLDHSARRALADATGISAISEPILEWGLAKAGREKKATDLVTPLAYASTRLSDEDRVTHEDAWRARGLKLDGTEHIACFFGTLSSVPEFETALEAIDHFPADIRANTRVVICGAGERLAWLQEQAKSRPELLLPGFVGSADIATLMAHATAGLLIYPSRKDMLISYPNKIGEYLSAGLPVLSTMAGISAKLLRDENCGVVVANHDAQALADAFAELVRNPKDRAAKSASAQRVFENMFDADKVYGRMADHLLALADAAR